jgi:hypothetical protein
MAEPTDGKIIPAAVMICSRISTSYIAIPFQSNEPAEEIA